MKKLLLFLLTLTAGCYERREENKIIRITTSPDFDKGESLRNTKRDSAYYFLNKVVDQSNDSLQIAMAYYYMAIIQMEEGDYFGSQEILLESMKYLNKGRKDDHYCLSTDYNALGNNSLNLKNYDAAINYYDVALQYAMTDDLKLTFLNNKAVAYQKKREYSRAISIYSSIINHDLKDKKEYARVLSNMARVKWLQDSTYSALSEFMQALKIRQDEKDDWGLNASYAHLSDFYSKTRPDSALLYATKMYEIAKRLESPDDELEALEKLIKLSPLAGLRKYITRYQFLNDSIQNDRNTAKNQFALIRYEVDKNKADNLKLQKENAEKRVQIIQQQTLLYGTATVTVLGAVFSIIWYRKRKQRMERESRSTIREERLKTSQKVHDVVANGLYRIMAGLEHRPAVEKEQLLDEIEVLYEKSRDISYEQPEVSTNGFQKTIADLLNSFVTPVSKIFVVGNNDILWKDIKVKVARELEAILQELMVNMKKHSGAGKVVLKFERENDQIKIHYQDDGVGLTSSFKFGNGLTNTENRIKDCGGRIIFENAEPKGLKIRITFPIS